MAEKRKWPIKENEWETDVNVMRQMVREKGGISGKVTLLPSSKV